MEDVWQQLERLEKTNSTNEKKDILVELFNNSKNGETFIRLAFDDRLYDVSDRSFEIASGYKKSEERYSDSGKLMEIKTINNNSNYTINIIENYLNELLKISGKDKINKLKNLLIYDKNYAKWITRLINKDLRIGVSIITINKALLIANKKIIKKFQVQLCGRFKDVKDYDKGLPAIGSIKYNGIRAVLNKIGNSVIFISRQGKIIDYVPELVEHFKKYKGNFKLDGEILCNNFQEIQQRIGRKLENIKKIEGLHFRCFDVLLGNDIEFKELTQLNRTTYINTLKEDKYFKIEEYKIIDTKEELEIFYNYAIKQNEEGIVVKLLNNKYEYDSRNNWFKIKPYIENTFKVISFDFGKGKNANIISSLEVEDKSTFIKSKVGSGITDKDKKLIMLLYKENKLIGSLVDIEYEKLQPELKGIKSLLFPRFLKFRNDINEPDTLDMRKKITLNDWFT